MVYFTDFFNINEDVLNQYGAFNISLINDLPLFIDPFLLYASKKEEYKKPVKITLSCQRKQIFTGFLAFILYSLSSVESSGTGEAVRVPKMALPSSVPAFSSFQDAPSFVRWKVAVAVMVA